MSRFDTLQAKVASVLDWIYDQDLKTVEGWQANIRSSKDAWQEYRNQGLCWHLDFSALYWAAMKDYSQETHRKRLRENAQYDLLLAKQRLEELE